MLQDELLAKYKQALFDKAQAAAEVKYLEMVIKLNHQPRTKCETTDRQRLIEQTEGQLDKDDLEFLSKSHRTVKEIEEYLGPHGPSDSTIRNRCKNGTYKFRTSTKGFLVDTVSVVANLMGITLDGQTSQD